MPCKYTNIGGQAVLEGVMMRSPDDEQMAIAVRKEDGQIVIDKQPSPDASKKNKFTAMPIVRGIVNFVSLFITGYRTISRSAQLYGLEEEEPSKFEKWLSQKLGKSVESIVMGVAMVLAVCLAVGLFMLLPALAAQLCKKVIDNRIVVNLIEGGVRLMIFLAYMISISLLKDIRRVFMYHGAEHKTIRCFEMGEELTPQNARKYPRQHPRCGTSFLLIVMVISILFFSVLGWDKNLFTRFFSRLLLMPIVAGISYEVLKLLGKYDNPFVRIVRAPGMWLQNLTTREPEESMLEVAIASFHAATNGRFEKEPVVPGENDYLQENVHDGIPGAARS